MTVTIAKAIQVARTMLTAAGIGSAHLDAELLLAHVIGQDRPWILAHDTDVLSPANHASYEALIKRRVNREPLVHLTGTREFYGLDIKITPDILTPRVETEQMVEWAIRYAPKDSGLVDIGTGSGAIAAAISTHRPDLQVTATDISETELEVARSNFEDHHTAIKTVVSDLWSNVDGKFETIVTNLPYLKDDADLMAEVTKEPAIALFGGPDGLSLYRRFLKDLPEHLKSGGFLFTECDPWQHADLIKEAALYDLRPIEQGYFILGFKLA